MGANFCVFWLCAWPIDYLAIFGRSRVGRRSVSVRNPIRIAPNMSSDASSRQRQGMIRILVCKPYHRSTPAKKGGDIRKKSEQKSRCPQWADDPRLRQALLDDALIDPTGGEDMFGRPKKLWNAIGGCYFIGRSCNTREPQYNCYPEYFPTGTLFEELKTRSERQVRDYIQISLNRR